MRRRIAFGLLIWLSAFAKAEEMKAFADGSWGSILRSHAGRPIIVHFWGLTCGPCRVEMPFWGRLVQQHQDFDFITVETDLLPGSSQRAAEFLTASGVTDSEPWQFEDGFAEKLYFQVDPKWQGEIPMTVLIGRDGRSQRIVGSVTTGIIETWLEAQKMTK